MQKNPPNPETYNLIVWTIASQIPAGEVSTYGQIASMIPPPDEIEPDDYKRLGAIWVGQAMNATPDGKGIPWQRVINSKGGISLPGAAAKQQSALLEEDGIKFDDKGLVDLSIYGWNGPADEWLQERGLIKPQPLRKPRQLSLF